MLLSCRAWIILIAIAIFLFCCGGLGIVQNFGGQVISSIPQKIGEAALSSAQSSAQGALDNLTRQTPIPITAKYVLRRIQGGENSEGWFGSVVTQTVSVDKTYGKDYRNGQIIPTDTPGSWFLNPVVQTGANALNGNVVRVQGQVLVQAGINVKDLLEADIKVYGNTVSICLPDAQVISSHFENSAGSTKSEIQGLLQHGDQDYGTLARSEAERDGQTTAINSRQILKQADTEAQDGVRKLLQLQSDPNAQLIRAVVFAPKPCR